MRGSVNKKLALRAPLIDCLSQPSPPDLPKTLLINVAQGAMIDIMNCFKYLKKILSPIYQFYAWDKIHLKIKYYTHTKTQLVVSK